MVRVLAVVPARMGSSRLPLKNRLEIEPGLSLAQHAVDCARHSGAVDHVVVSTDAPEDLPIRNAFVSLRPHDLASGTADISAVVQHELAAAERQMRLEFSHVAVLQPAVLARSPLIVGRLIREVIATGARGGLTMCPVHPWIWTGKERLTAPWLPGPYPRSQDSGKMWQEINACQVATAEVVRGGGRWGWPLVIQDLPTWAAALDIDTAADLAEARDLWPFARRKLETWTGTMTTWQGPGS